MNYATQDSTVIPETYVEQVWSKIDNLFNQASILADLLTIKTDVTLLSILNSSFQSLLKTINANQNTTHAITAIYKSRLQEERIDTACSNLSYLSALGWNSFEGSGGDQMINLKSGYISLINYFISVIGKSSIFLNESVSQIKYPTSGGVSGNPVNITSYNTYTGVTTVHQADYVLTTFPLGYLKSYYKTLFVPSLPI